MHILFLFIIGSSVGSFVNLCAHRMPRNRSVIYPSSRCDYCGKKLPPLHLIPIFGYMINKSRSACCGRRLSPTYPLVELSLGFAFVASFLIYGLSIVFFMYTALISVVILGALIDMRHMIIPNRLIILGLAIAIFFRIIQAAMGETAQMIEMLLGIVAGALPLYLVILLSKGGMGAGDMKFMAMAGAFLGLKWTLVALFISVMFAGVLAFFLLAFKLMNRRSKIPFGPFISFGTAVVIFFQSQLSLFLAVYYGL